MLIAINQG